MTDELPASVRPEGVRVTDELVASVRPEGGRVTDELAADVRSEGGRVTDELPAGVRAAFGVSSGPARRLLGGGGTSWRAGGLVLKPGQQPAAAAWFAEVFDGLRGPGFRVPRPARTAAGAWVVEGWVAWEFVEGEPDPVGRWPELVAAGRSFHAALAEVPRPRWLGRRRDRWAVADRAVWDGASVPVAPELDGLVGALRAAIRPIALPEQLVHGDLAGNVLFADGVPPAVIDFSPTWRPAEYALAVAAVDVLTWSGAPPSVLDGLDDQLLLRALMWRLITASLGRPDPESREAVRRANEPVVDLLLARLRGVTPILLDDQRIAALAAALIGRPVSALKPLGRGHSRALTRIASIPAASIPASSVPASSMPGDSIPPSSIPADLVPGGSVPEGSIPQDLVPAGLDAAGSVFVKAGADVEVELAVYEGLGKRAFLARRLGSTRSPVPMLVLETLDSGGWVEDWNPELIEATRSLLHEVHSLPAPAGVPRIGAAANPWTAIAADPARLLRLQVCSAKWLTANLDTLSAAAASARTEGDSLIHRDVCAANLWHHDGRLVLAGWGSAAIGDPWFDLHLWLVALGAEGGPAPSLGQGPHAVGQAALIAGLQVLLAPSRDSNPTLFDLRRRRLQVALAWAAHLLELPPPGE